MASAASNLHDDGGNERFNAEAAAWDSNPFVHAMSGEAWKAIQRYTPFFKNETAEDKPDVLEIGCGTGLLSMMVAPSANRVIAVDAAPGMIEVLKGKLSKPGVPSNIRPIAVLLEDPEDPNLPPANDDSDGGANDDDDNDDDPTAPRLKYDLITSHLVLHHIPNLAPVLRTMFHCLKPGTGRVALTDFEDFGPEARRFHPQAKMAGVERHGIPRAWMEGLMREAGFVDVEVGVAWEHEKVVERFPGDFGEDARGGVGKGERMKFSYVICLGRRP